MPALQAGHILLDAYPGRQPDVQRALPWAFTFCSFRANGWLAKDEHDGNMGVLLSTWVGKCGLRKAQAEKEMNHRTALAVSPLLRLPKGDRTTRSRQMAELALGVVEAFRKSSITWEQAREDVFNLDNYLKAKKLRLDPRLIEAFEWAMEMEDVSELAPKAMGESYDQVASLLNAVIRYES